MRIVSEDTGYYEGIRHCDLKNETAHLAGNSLVKDFSTAFHGKKGDLLVYYSEMY